MLPDNFSFHSFVVAPWTEGWKQAKEQILPEGFSFRTSVALPVFGESRLAKWAEGWERVKDIYRKELSFEHRLAKMGIVTSFGMGYLIGGASTIRETKRRFEVFTAGKIYIMHPHNQLRSRRLSYMFLRFNTKGCKVGFKLTCVISSVTALFLLPVTFRQHFSLLNFPLATFIVLGTHTFFRGWGSVAWHASIPPTIIASSLPFLVMLGYCMQHKCSPNEAYWFIKEKYELEIRADADYALELKAYQTARGKSPYYYYFPWAPMQMERERELGTWRWDSSADDGLKFLKETEENAAGDDDELSEEDQKVLETLDKKRKGKLLCRIQSWWYGSGQRGINQ